MIRLGLPLLLAASLLAGAAHAADLPTPLGLHGFNLGMTLVEVRGQKFPGPAATKAELICSGDNLSNAEEIELLPGEALRTIGVKACRFFAVEAGAKHKAPLKVAGRDAEVTFLATPKSDDPATSERLYLIVAKAEPAHYEEFVRAYTAQLGRANVRIGRYRLWQDARVSLFIGDEPGQSSSVVYLDKALSQKAEPPAEDKAKSDEKKLQ